ncbi:MAG: hypothetical protein ABJA02_09785 [Acidobacteriota bacterium]
MKKLLLIAAVAALANIAAYGQKDVHREPAAGARPPTAAFTREKFDQNATRGRISRLLC